MIQVGIIGMGDMGKLYASAFRKKGFQLNICDIPEKYSSLVNEFKNDALVSVFQDGFGVSRTSDFIIYSVETAMLQSVVAKFGPATKVGAIVGGQTSVKDPEIEAFEKYLPIDVQIITFHSLHGPNVHPKGQPLVIIRHRATDQAYDLALEVLNSLESKIVFLTYKQQ